MCVCVLCTVLVQVQGCEGETLECRWKPSDLYAVKKKKSSQTKNLDFSSTIE